MYTLLLNLIGNSFLKFCYNLAIEFSNKFRTRLYVIEFESQMALTGFRII
jgi:hypothetical protein